jgi:O-antigen/teichoic acid export membrane protein
VVGYYLGRGTLGVFVSVFYLAMIGSKIAGALGPSSGPRLARYYADGNLGGFGRLLGKLLAAALCLASGTVLGMALLGRFVLVLVYNAQFAQYADLGVWLMLAAGVGYLAHPLGMALVAMRRFRTHMVIRGVAIGVLSVAATFLVPRFGLPGIAAAIFIANSFLAAGCACAVLDGVRRCPTRDSGRLGDAVHG